MKRGPSQSMYQGGVVGNKSMAVSKVLGSSLTDGLTGKSMLGNKSSIKKVEGHDLGRTAKSNFEQTVHNLKSKPNQKGLEDEYIGGLQQEIKYLEYELKLLKDKEILEREGVNELDNFLKDEIPINENILAMKNKYNATKVKLQQQLSSFNMRKNQAQEVLSVQKGQINRLHQIINAHRRQTEERREEFRQKLSQATKETTLAVDEYESVGNDSRRMNEQVKKMNEEIAAILRQGEKEKIGEVRIAEEKAKKLDKFEQKFKNNRQKMIQAAQQCQELSEIQDVNPLVKPLEDQNSILRKRIMINQKQKSTADNAMAEIELYLSEQARERQLQRQHKFKYLAVIDECRAEVQYIERQGENILKDQTLRAKKVQLKEMNNDLSEKEDVYNLLTNRLRTLEGDCSNLIQDKKELNDAVQIQSKIQKQILSFIAQTEQSIAYSRSTTDSLKRVTETISIELVQIQDQLEKCKGRIPMAERQSERKSTTIHYLNKQIDLLKELKSLDLQQLHMISQSGVGVQNVLNSFIKNWEKIKSM